MSAARDEFAPEALDAFARLVERLESGEAIDLEREIASSGVSVAELRELFERHARLERAFGALGEREEALEVARRELFATRSGSARYQLVERIGAGGMGEVWRARDNRTGREVALKRLRDDLAHDPRVLRRFVDEARLSAALEHPGIVAVHDVGLDDDGRAYFTMPLVRGESLAQILDRSGDRVPSVRVLEILLKVCDAVAFAHAHGVVHRDVKPANVMVGQFGEVFVLDWGLARALAPGSTKAEVAGTPAYMAPEQARGEPAVAPADVHGIGAMLWHALARKRPYAELGDDTDAVLAAVRSRPPLASELRGADPELAAIAQRALEREPSRRYASVAELAADLRAYVDGRVVRAHRVGAWPELVKWTKRNRALATTLATAALASVVALVFFASYRAEKERELRELRDLELVRDLDDDLERLWPATPAQIGSYRSWLDAFAEVEERFDQRASALRQIEARRVIVSDRALPATAGDARRFTLLRELEQRLSRLRDPDPAIGGVASIRGRLEFASALERRSLIEARAAWQSALDEIAEAPVYGGLRFPPQLGLVPLGRDPVSRLQEFAELASGAAPRRDERGNLVLDETSAIVLVLVPGGAFHLGSKAPVPGQPSTPITDKLARPEETPRSSVELEPFFLAKHETTRAQWQRVMGRAIEGDPRLPAASLSHAEALVAAHRLGLRLPTEAQWERAARAGTESRYWTGDAPASLAGAANGRPVIDVRAVGDAPVDGTLPVGTLRANPFGLHDVLGNVAEWTHGVATGGFDPPPSGGHGYLLAGDERRRVVRGGSFASLAPELRCASRAFVAPENRDERIGARFARMIVWGRSDAR